MVAHVDGARRAVGGVHRRRRLARDRDPFREPACGAGGGARLSSCSAFRSRRKTRCAATRFRSTLSRRARRASRPCAARRPRPAARTTRPSRKLNGALDTIAAARPAVLAIQSSSRDANSLRAEIALAARRSREFRRSAESSGHEPLSRALRADGAAHPAGYERSGRGRRRCGAGRAAPGRQPGIPQSGRPRPVGRGLGTGVGARHGRRRRAAAEGDWSRAINNSPRRCARPSARPNPCRRRRPPRVRCPD